MATAKLEIEVTTGPTMNAVLDLLSVVGDVLPHLPPAQFAELKAASQIVIARLKGNDVKTSEAWSRSPEEESGVRGV